jgi:hypothetical protein
LSRLAASFVLGYHGCDAEVAHKLVNRKDEIRPSGKKYDWLGPGIYFWESDPHRAMDRLRLSLGRNNGQCDGE